MSEIAQIQFNGLSNEPNDYAHEDGDMSVSINAVMHLGSIRPVGDGEELFEFAGTMRLVFIHESGDDKQYVFMQGSDMLYIRKEELDAILNDGERTDKKITSGDCTLLHTFDEEVLKVTNVRRVLVVSTSDGIRYARYDGSNYKYLGSFPNMPYVYPYIKTRTVITEDMQTLLADYSVATTFPFSKTGEYDYTSEMYNMLNSEMKEHSITGKLQEAIYEKFQEIVNVMRSKLHESGEFTAPFFVRFALRMYDGTYASVSRPYAMCPTSTFNPLCIFKSFTAEGTKVTSGEASVVMPASTLQIYVTKIGDDWKDIITGIDVFVSDEVTNYTDDKKSYASIVCGNTSDEGNIKGKYLFDYYTNNAESGCTSPCSYVSTRNVVNDLTKTPKHLEYVSTVSKSAGGKLWQVSKKTYKYAFLVPKSANASMKQANYVSISKTTSGTYYNYIVSELGEDVPNNFDIFIPSGRGGLIYIGGNTNVQIYKLYYEATQSSTTAYAIIEQKRTDGKEVGDAFCSVGEFYKLASIDFGEVSDGDIITPDIPEYCLAEIETMPTLKDNTVRNYKYVCRDVVALNNRLNVVVDNQTIEHPDYTDTFVYGTTPNVVVKPSYSFVVEYVRDGAKYYSSSAKFSTDKGRIPYYIYYPSLNATNVYAITDSASNAGRVNIEGMSVTLDGVDYTISSFSIMSMVSKRARQYAAIPLSKHERLSGSYAFSNFEPLAITDSFNSMGTIYGYTIPSGTSFANSVTFAEEFPDESTRKRAIKGAFLLFKSALASILSGEGYTGTIDYSEGKHDVVLSDIEDEELVAAINACNGTFHVGNKIMQSEVENPFVMLNTSVNQLNCEGVNRICSSNKPISQGQFGDYPLYAFADNGIWALNTSDTGTYSSIAPISQDVCINPSSVTQLDQSVQFVTARGLMQLEGGAIQCLTTAIDGHNYTDTISKFDSVQQLCGNAVVDIPAHIEEYMKDVSILYAYKTQKIYYFKDGESLGYVYDVVEGKWGMFVNEGLSYPIGGYESALAVYKKSSSVHSLIDISTKNTNEQKTIKSLMITRPLSFGLPDTYKTIEDITLRGVFDWTSMKLVIWASNDSKHFWVVGTSSTYKWRNHSGTPYKYYRVGVIANWKEQDSLNGMSITYTERMNNKIR